MLYLIGYFLFLFAGVSDFLQNLLHKSEVRRWAYIRPGTREKIFWDTFARTYPFAWLSV